MSLILSSVQKILVKLPWAYIIAITFLICGVYWLADGWSISERLSRNNPAAQAEAQIKDVIERNPQLGTKLAQARELYGDRPVAVKLLHAGYEKERYMENLTAIEQQLDRQEMPFEIRLAALADQTGLSQNAEKMEAFFNSYGALGSAIEDYRLRNVAIDKLEEAAVNPDVWKYIYDDSYGYLVWEITKGNGDLWRFWKDERVWFSDELMGYNFHQSIISEAEKEHGIDLVYSNDYIAWLRDALTTGYKYRKEMREAAMQIPESIGINLALFMRFGNTITRTYREYGVPIDEVLAVLYSNPTWQDAFILSAEKRGDNADPAFQLGRIYREHHTVWECAMQIDYTLQLYNDVPQYADEFLAEYGQRKGFLLQLYAVYGAPDVLPVAMQSIHIYKDTAVAILGEFQHDPRMVEFLKNPKIGHRIIPFAARLYNKSPLDKVESDYRYIDKYFDKDGKSTEHERWWEALPGGSIAKIATNYANGYPNDWSELGWAVMDVVTVAMILIPEPTSSTAGVALRAGAKQTGKLLLRPSQSILRAGSKQTGKLLLRPAQSIAQKATRLAIKSSARAPITKSTKNILSVLSRNTSAAAKVTARGAVILTRNITNVVVHSYRYAGRAWRNLPPSVQKSVIRGAGVALGVYKLYARADTLALAPQQIGELIGKISRGAIESATTVLAAAATEILTPLIPSTMNNPYIPYLTVPAICFAGGVFMLYRITNRRKQLIKV